MARVIDAHHDVRDELGRRLVLVPGECRQRPAIIRWGATGQRRGAHREVDGEVESETAPQQQTTVEDEDRTRRRLLVRRAGRTLAHRIPERGHVTAGPLGPERVEGLAGQRGGIEPVLVERVGVAPPVLPAQRGGTQEVTCADADDRSAVCPQRSDERVGQLTGACRRRPVHSESPSATGITPGHQIDDMVDEGRGGHRLDAHRDSLDDHLSDIPVGVPGPSSLVAFLPVRSVDLSGGFSHPTEERAVMKRLLVLGAGTAGTMVVNKLRRRLDARTWDITVVDRDDVHPYQPGFLFLPFGVYSPAQVTRSRHRFIADHIDFVIGEVDRVDAAARAVTLRDGRSLAYDYLVIASGTSPRPDQTPGMLGPEWRRSIFDFYTLEGSLALTEALRHFDHGRLVVHIADTPIKCPVAPLEFTFLADAWLRQRGLRDRVDLVYVTPLPGAFTKPIASQYLGSMLDDRQVTVESDFLVERIDDDTKTLVSYDEREVPFDLLVTIPVNMGADFIARSGLGDELNYVPVDKCTLLSKAWPTIFAVGDANDIPTSKAGSVAHFSVEVFVENFLEHVSGQLMTGSFDGHANCFIESGNGKGLLIDFNYDTEPLPGTYPLPLVGPLELLKETRGNHLGKLAFRWIYWNILLPGRPMPLPAHMSMVGKTVPASTSSTD
jgi:sulfide:quinone oxidoreductase